MTRIPLSALSLFLCLELSACNGVGSWSDIAHPPAMTHSSNPTLDGNYRPLTMPMPPLQPPPAETASLWRTGSRAFFKDQRATQVGDLVTIIVDITDNATMVDNTTASASGNESMGIPSLFGLQGKFISHLTQADALSTSSSNGNTAQGTITRNETVTISVAGTITQVLPNGNFVVVARQEVRVNNELRNLELSGVVRPQDITADNTVTHDRMAEARISYGGRGQLSILQSPRWGQQIIDAIAPL
ncbi:MAG: flagellar basal body L-ring protein FlgH [Acetobacter sp.]|jgi:flagellar L-ring protein precursor FlgH|nr:flagellar basal body L-ring protein FlgH [Acetobacter sp.]MCH4062080.1 flagellar basal body L-ring protein FlgH [Acetobacter sp.]MCH4089073.1 flagellar basal body L-ring protein FlgH [Acetobacter sp.]MCI1293203.1 flagellar basal body L-ring protein FlgH [Acetobacter sp.]MCI1320174.1 flagellar basal body L-ring protein FlgH [Acetobacter sp.]